MSSFCDGLRLQQVKYSEICSKVQKFEEELTNKNQEISYLSKQLTEKEGEINRITQREAKLNQHNF